MVTASIVRECLRKNAAFVGGIVYAKKRKCSETGSSAGSDLQQYAGVQVCQLRHVGWQEEHCGTHLLRCDEDHSREDQRRSVEGFQEGSGQRQARAGSKDEAGRGCKLSGPGRGKPKSPDVVKHSLARGVFARPQGKVDGGETCG